MMAASPRFDKEKVPLRFLRGIIIFVALGLLLSSCVMEPEEDQLNLCEDNVCVLAYSGLVINEEDTLPFEGEDGPAIKWSAQVTGDTVVIKRLGWYNDECFGFYRLVLTNDSVSSLPCFQSCTYTESHFIPEASTFTKSMKMGTVEIQDWELDGVVSGKVSGFGEPYDSFLFRFSFWAGIGAESEGEIWVYIDPIQCLGNPWERAWLGNHDYDEYPRDEEQRLKIFSDFFEAQGVTIYELYTTIWAEVVCGACSCPTGERIHCLIDEDYLSIMLKWGFREEA